MLKITKTPLYRNAIKSITKDEKKIILELLNLESIDSALEYIFDTIKEREMDKRNMLADIIKPALIAYEYRFPNDTSERILLAKIKDPNLKKEQIEIKEEWQTYIKSKEVLVIGNSRWPRDVIKSIYLLSKLEMTGKWAQNIAFLAAKAKRTYWNFERKNQRDIILQYFEIK